MDLKDDSRIAKKSHLEKVESFLPMRAALQKALHDTVYKSNIPPKKIAEKLGISYGLLVNAANPHLRFKLSAACILPLMRITGNFALLEAMARETGHAVYRLPVEEVKNKDSVDPLKICIGLNESWAGMMTAFTNYLSGSKESWNEEVEININLLIAQAAKLSAVLKRSRRNEKRFGCAQG